MGVDAPIIFDVGANRGQTVDHYQEYIPNARLYCFEPVPDTVKILEEKIKDRANVSIFPMALSDKPGRRNFYVNGSSATNSLLPRETAGRRYFPSFADFNKLIEVDVTSIDHFLDEHKIDHIDILKFDIQGGELMALKGAAKTLQAQRISLIYTEAFFIPHYEGSPLLHDLWSYLESFQYSLFGLYGIRRANNGQVRFGNALFVNEQVRRNVVDQFPDEP
jgi:FkbM family methyltransferase